MEAQELNKTTLATCQNESCVNKDDCKRYSTEEAVINFANICYEENGYEWLVKK